MIPPPYAGDPFYRPTEYHGRYYYEVDANRDLEAACRPTRWEVDFEDNPVTPVSLPVIGSSALPVVGSNGAITDAGDAYPTASKGAMIGGAQWLIAHGMGRPAVELERDIRETGADEVDACELLALFGELNPRRREHLCDRSPAASVVIRALIRTFGEERTIHEPQVEMARPRWRWIRDDRPDQAGAGLLSDQRVLQVAAFAGAVNCVKAMVQGLSAPLDKAVFLAGIAGGSDGVFEALLPRLPRGQKDVVDELVSECLYRFRFDWASEVQGGTEATDLVADVARAARFAWFRELESLLGKVDNAELEQKAALVADELALMVDMDFGAPHWPRVLLRSGNILSIVAFGWLLGQAAAGKQIDRDGLVWHLMGVATVRPLRLYCEKYVRFGEERASKGAIEQVAQLADHFYLSRAERAARGGNMDVCQWFVGRLIPFASSIPKGRQWIARRIREIGKAVQLAGQELVGSEVVALGDRFVGVALGSADPPASRPVVNSRVAWGDP